MINEYKKAKIDGRVTTVVKPDEALQYDIYQNKFTSVEIGDTILPVKTSYDPTVPGFYIMNGGKIAKAVFPNDKDKDEYSSSNAINFSDAIIFTVPL